MLNLRAISCFIQTVNIFLTDMNSFGIVNVLMSEFFGEHKPVRSTIEVQGLPKDAMIEMDFIATVSDYK